jgi:hypothetical protein
MGQKSAVDKLPKKLRTKLIKMLQDPACTQIQIADEINKAADEPLISKSSVNRYALRMKTFSEKNRQAKEVAELYLEKYGEGRNKLGKIVNEQVRLVAFELISELDELKEKKKIKPKEITDLIFKVSRGLRDLELAEKLNAERANDIRKDTLEEAAKIAEKSARQDGVSKKTIDKIKKEILGV